nr:DEAD/DEAH box helicase [uncultured Arsenicibacter sp.]
MTFSQLGLIDPILKALREEGYSTPTPIQQQAIPLVLDGNDLLGVAQTGTGKTAAFAIPMLQRLNAQPRAQKGARPVRALILTPTRELAIQIGESFTAYGRHLPLRHTVIFGGVGQRPQTDALKAGIDVIIATPGRLLDLMNQGYISLKSLNTFVLDEADRMLDMGFVHDVKKVIAKLPAERQSLFFSATMPTEVAKLANSILSNPARVEVTPVSSTADTVQQKLYYVEKNDKRKLLAYLLEDQSIASALVFTRTKHGADRVAKDLGKVGVKAEAIHGNKSQTARQRALNNFKSGQTRVLVATDIAARGIDIDELSHVINYELPNIPETYVHRIGRTGRAGNRGMAYSFCDGEERAYLKDIQKLIGKSIPVAEIAKGLLQSLPEPAPDAPQAKPAAQKPAQKSGQRSFGKGQGNGQKPSGERQKDEKRQAPAQAAPTARSGESGTTGNKSSRPFKKWNRPRSKPVA